MTTDLLKPYQKAAIEKVVERARPSVAAIYLARCNAASRETMRYSLAAILRYLGADADVAAFPWERLRHAEVSAIRSKLEELCAPATANRHLAALRGVLEAAFDEDHLTAKEYELCKKASRKIKGDSPLAGRMLRADEIAFMMAKADERDRAILALATYGGLRREELAALRFEDVDLEGEMREVRILGKGSKRRNVFLPEAAAKALDAWVRVRGREPGPLFYRATRSADRYGKRGAISVEGIWSIIITAAARADVKDVTPHDFRRTYASTLLDEGMDLPTVQALMGHSSPETTVKYDRRGDERKKRAAEVIGRMLK